MADVQQTYKFNFEFDRKNVKKQLKDISLDVKDAIEKMGDASDKVVIFKEMISYLSAVDKALDAFKTKHQDDFTNLFGNPDTDMLNILTTIFNTTQQSAQAFVELRDKISSAESGKASLQSLRGIAQEINDLFVTVGKAPPINIDEMFTGKGSKTKGTDFASRIKLLNDSLVEFGTTYSGFQDRLKGGLNFGGSGGHGNADGELNKIKKQVESLEEQLFKYKHVKEELQKISQARNEFKKTQWLDESISVEYSVDSIKELISAYSKAKKAKSDFEEKGDTSSLEYYENLLKLKKTALQIDDIHENYVSDDDDLMKQLNGMKYKGGSILSFLENIKFDDDFEAIFDDAFGNIDDSIAQTQSLITGLQDNLNNINVPVSDIGGAFDSIGAHVDEVKAKVDALSDAIKNVFVDATDLEIKAGKGEIESKETMNLFGADGTVSGAIGISGRVDTDTIASQLVANLRDNIVMSLHNHANGNDMFSPQDLETFATLYYGQGTKIHGIIADGMIKTIDFNGISQELAVKIAKSYADSISNLVSKHSNLLTYEDGHVAYTDLAKKLQVSDPDLYEDMILSVQSEINDALHSAFAQNGVESTIKQFEYGQIQDLAQHLIDVRENAQSALDPIEKLKNLVVTLYPNKEINWDDHADILGSFGSGAIDGTQAINKILNLKTTSGTTAELQQAGDAAKDAETKLQSFLELGKEIQGKGFMDHFNARDNVAIGEYTERLNVAKKEMDALGEQGLITAQQLDEVNAVYAKAKEHLRGETVGYSGYGNGSYSYSYYDEYEAAKDEADLLREENAKLKGQLGDAQNRLSDIDKEITRLKDQIKELKAQKKDTLKEFGNQAAKFTKDQMVAGLDFDAVQEAYNTVASLGPVTQMTYPEAIKDAAKMNANPNTSDIAKAIFQMFRFPEKYGVKAPLSMTSQIDRHGDTHMFPLGNGMNLVLSGPNGDSRHYGAGASIVPRMFDDASNIIGGKGINFLTPDAIVKYLSSDFGISAEEFGKIPLIQQAYLDSQKQFEKDKAFVSLISKFGNNLPEYINAVKGPNDSLIDIDRRGAETRDQLARLTAEKAVVEQEIGSLNTLLDAKKDAPAEIPVVPVVDPVDVKKAVVPEVPVEVPVEPVAVGPNAMLAESASAPIDSTVTDTDTSLTKTAIAAEEAAANLTKVAVAADEADKPLDSASTISDDVATYVGAPAQDTVSDLGKVTSAIQEVGDAASVVAAQTDDAAKQLVEDATVVSDDEQKKSKIQGLVNVLQGAIDKADAPKPPVEEHAAVSDDEQKKGKIQGLVNVLQGVINKADSADAPKVDDGVTDAATTIAKAGQAVSEVTDDLSKMATAATAADKPLDAVSDTVKDIAATPAVDTPKVDEAVADLGKAAGAIKEVGSAAKDAQQATDTANKKTKKQKESASNNSTKKAAGATVVRNARSKYNSLNNIATSDEFADSSVVQQKLASYTAAYQKLVDIQSKFKPGEELTQEQEDEFDAARIACSNYAKELEKVITASQKLRSNSSTHGKLDGDFVDDINGRATALQQFVEDEYGAKIVTTELKDECNKMLLTIDNGDGTFSKLTAEINAARNSIDVTVNSVEEASGSFAKFWNELKSKFKSVGAYFMASFGIQEVIQMVKQGVQYVKEIDGALTELKKVTNETDAAYDKFLQDMSKTAGVVGSTVAELTTMAAEWARLGYTMEESAKLAESTAILLNVSEFENATEASEALISTMQAFQYTADESQHVVDILNEVGNNYAVSSDGIATALQDSASALMEAGNNLEQSVALVAAANKVVQDPNSVGSALRTISLRLRGTSVEVLEQMGEETDGVVESVSKMQSKIEALTGVNILTDSGAYKDTYTILYEIGQVWEDMSDIDQAALLELMAGKNRANTLAAILGNMEDLEGAYNSALNAEGSAMKENEAYLDSIQGRIDLFTNSVQTMWMNLIDSDVIKGIVDIGTALVKLVDTLGLIPTLLVGFAGFRAVKTIFTDMSAAIKAGNFALSSLLNTQGQMQAFSMITNKLGFSFVGLGASIKQAAASFWTFLTTTPLGWAAIAIAAIVGVVAIVDALTTSHDEYIEKLNEETTALKEVQSQLKNVNNELQTTRDRIEELQSKGTLSFVEQEELNHLKEQTLELERQEQILQTQEKRARDNQIKTALNALKTDADINYGALRAEANNPTSTPYAASLQDSNTEVPDAYEVNLNALEVAMEDLDKAKTAWAAIRDTESKEYKKLEKKVKDAEDRVNKYRDAIEGLNETWETKYGGIDYVENATAEHEKQWNEAYRQHQDSVDRYMLMIGGYNDGKATVLDRVFGQTGTDVAKDFKEKFESAINSGKTPVEVIEELLANGNYSSMLKELNEKFGITASDISGYFTQVEEAAQTQSSVASVKAYSDLLARAEEYNEVLKQTSEISYDNIKVTQEYKDSLLNLGISEEELNECFDENNGLIVKNSALLNDLVKSSKKDVAQNVKLAKSQARLKYYDLYKQMKTLTNGKKISNATTLAQVNAIYQEMSALQKVISQYSVLEHKLLGATNAYEKLSEAQEVDSAIDYSSKAEEMVNVLANAFNTSELGTQAAQTAIDGLIPDDVIDKTKTLDEQMQQIYSYFTTGTMTKLFTIDFDDNGGISSVEMTKKNVESFTESLIGSAEEGAVFQGTWDEFTLNPAITTLKQFADEIGTTEEVAFAYLTALEKYDISWLGGDSSTLLDQLMGDDFEYQAHKNIEALAELEYQLANGSVSSDEYAKKYSELSEAQDKNNKKIKDNALAWSSATTEVDEATQKVEDVTKELNLLKESGATDQEIQIKTEELESASKELSEALKKKYDLQEPTTMTVQIALDEINQEIEEFKANNSVLLTKIQIEKDKDGNHTYTVNADVNLSDEEKAKVDAYMQTLNDQYTITVLADENPDDSTEELEKVKSAAEAAEEAIENIPDPQIDTSKAIKAINDLQTAIDNIEGTKVDIYETTHKKTVYSVGFGGDDVNGTAHVNGTAYKSGSWGASKTETALVGELGPELLVRGSRWTTIGDNGAEFTQVKKGDIIFNHKQTQDLLSKGYITGRGKLKGGNAFAHGTAFAGINTWDDAHGKVYEDYSNLSNVADSISDAADEFHEVFDWIEVRLEEIDEDLNLLSAQLENASSYLEKNNIVDSMIGVNQTKVTNLAAGIAEYAEYAAKLLNEVPAQFRDAAQNGAIAITDFAGDANEATVEAINNYREWAQKVADLKQQLEEVKTEIRDLARQKFDNIYDAGDVKATVEGSQTEKLQNAVDLIEESGKIATEEYYKAMMENSNKTIEYLTSTRDEMQKVFNEAVEAGIIVKGSNEWYEMIDQLYQVDAEIDAATKELEEFQNAINDIYWDNFDQLINRLDYLKSETQNLVDLMDSDDLVDDNGNWTDEGLASLGLHAQQMEIAEYRARQYAEAIDDLTADYEAGLYSENEYAEKLAELKDAQYESIEAYYDAQDAIVELNKARTDSIKKGIEKEIEAYEELINKKKEALESEKDLYDFQRSTMEKQKTIAEIERQLAALANDNSLSAAAKRKQLEAELAEAQYELQDEYYNRSVEDKQSALDKELESFKAEKEAEVEALDEYLENVEAVVAESLGIVQANATSIYDTLIAKASEYDLAISDAIMTPWQDGSFAVSDYQTQFDTAMNSTMDQLEALKNKWQEVIDKMLEASKAEVSAMHKENNNYASAEKKQDTAPSTSSNSSNQAAKEEKAIAVGGKINAKGAKIYSSIGGKGYEQYYGNDPIYVVLSEQGGYLQVRHHKSKSGVTGWFKKSDVKGYRTGTLGTKKDELAWIDEMGLEELVLHAGPDGRLQYLTKGTSVIPSDISENLMQLGQLDPSAILERNRPQVGFTPSVVNNTMEIKMDIAEVVHIDRVDSDTIPDLTKAVRKEMDSYMVKLNNAIRSKVR